MQRMRSGSRSARKAGRIVSPCLCEPRPDQPTDQSMAAAGRDTQAPGNDVPANRAHQCAEYDAGIHDICFDDAFTYRLSHMQADKEKGYEVKKGGPGNGRSEEHTSELQSLLRSSYAVFCLKKQKRRTMTYK